MLSIVVLVHNQHDVTEECLLSLMECTQDYELVLVDNGSSPPAVVPFSRHPKVLIRNEKNLGFPAAVNQGIKAASGDVICLLNNDVIVTPGWFEKLNDALNEFDIVGPVTNYAAGVQRVSIRTYTSKEGLYKAASDWAEDCDEIKEVRYIIGFCMVFKKSVFEAVGDFDDSWFPCTGEEVDFCFRAIEQGFSVGVVMGCYIHHYGSKTLMDMESRGEVNYEELCRKNDDHLQKKWGKEYWLRQTLNSSPEVKGVCLNLGCGYNKKDGFINIDNRQEVGPDLVCDVIEGLPYEDNSVDIVRADDFLEHIPIGKVIQVMDEIWRVLKPGGIFESSTPSTDGRGAFQDPTHVSFWNCNSWLYYSDPAYRGLYGIKANFEILSMEENEPDPRWMIIHTHVIARKNDQ